MLRSILTALLLLIQISCTVMPEKSSCTFYSDTESLQKLIKKASILPIFQRPLKVRSLMINNFPSYYLEGDQNKYFIVKSKMDSIVCISPNEIELAVLKSETKSFVHKKLQQEISGYELLKLGPQSLNTPGFIEIFYNSKNKTVLKNYGFHKIHKSKLFSLMETVYKTEFNEQGETLRESQTNNIGFDISNKFTVELKKKSKQNYSYNIISKDKNKIINTEVPLVGHTGQHIMINLAFLKKGVRKSLILNRYFPKASKFSFIEQTVTKGDISEEQKNYNINRGKFNFVYTTTNSGRVISIKDLNTRPFSDYTIIHSL